MTALVWLTRDLRVHDHPALRAALTAHEQVVPVFCLDERLLHGRNSSATRTAFMLDCLRDLDGSLRRRGGRLLIRRGDPARELADLVREAGASEVHCSGDVSPYAKARLSAVSAAVRERGASVIVHPGSSVVGGVAAIATSAGRPYTVFTPFWRAWLKESRRKVLGAPRKIEVPSRLVGGRLPALAGLGLGDPAPKALPGGEGPGRERLRRFLSTGVEDYERRQDDLGQEGVSRLSPYLRFGCVSPAEVESRLPVSVGAGAGVGAGVGAGADAFARQLCWRDFFRHLMHHFPETVGQELQERYRGMAWSEDGEALSAWQEGMTGYPLVDAAMRQLKEEGWMHNRTRLLVGSFLTKDLGIDWRLGERWFMKMLLDGDPASNVGNWQWIASVGSDRQPVYRRVLSPTRQLARFDPEGVYVRRYVPELANVDRRHLAEPWTMGAEAQEEAGCVIGKDYPAPIVDHATAREEAIARYREAGA